MATTAQRNHAVRVMEMMYAHRWLLDYPPGDQRSSRDNVSWWKTEAQMLAWLKAGGRPQLDCSEYAPWVLRCAGLWPYSQPGWTGSHLELWAWHKWKVYTDGRAAYPGALVIFGEGSGHHEAIVMRADPTHGDPIVSSHGRPGLDEVHVSAMAAEQARSGHPGVRYLSISGL